MRLIDAEALRDEWLYKAGKFEPNDVLDSIDYAPTIDSVKHGRWIEIDNHYLCSNCGAACHGVDLNYCPNCGARMDEVTDIFDRFEKYKKEEYAMAENSIQLDKLEEYLKENGIKYERIDTRNIHQINVPNSRDKEWDAICHYGSFGYKEGLLEIYGSIVPENVGNIEGYLTAEDVVNRIDEYGKRQIEKAWTSLNSRFT